MHCSPPCFQLYYENLCKKKGQKNLELKAMARKKYKNLDPKKKIKYIALSAIELYTYEVSVSVIVCVRDAVVLKSKLW